jgi:excisionase family DNA binding protein
MTKQLPDLLTVPQVADYLQMSIPTIRRWVAEGRIQSIKIGRARRIPREVVLNLIEAGMEGNPGPERKSPDGE